MARIPALTIFLGVGKSYIPVSEKVFDNEEIDNAIEAAKDGWWTED